MVAGLQFLDPILFGRVIGLLSNSNNLAPSVLWHQAASLLAIWAGVGVAGIASNIAVSVQAERLAHRNRIQQLGRYFAHVLGMPLSFHADIHSGRLMKVMITGTDGLFGIWLVFFRDQLSTVGAVIVLLPLTLLMNWRLALSLIVLVIIFVSVTSFVIRQTQAGQRMVEGANSRLAGTTQDALTNVMVVQSFTRLAAETRMFSDIAQEVIQHQFPVLNWWALVNVLTRASSTMAVISIVLIGTVLMLEGQATVAEIVSFMGFATLLIARLDFGLQFVTTLFLRMPSLEEYFSVIDARSSVPEFSEGQEPGHHPRGGGVRPRLLRVSRRTERSHRCVVQRAQGPLRGVGRTDWRRQIHRHGPAAASVGSILRARDDRRSGPA